MNAQRATNTEPPSNAYIVIEGRRWRASDPSIPPALRRELVDELMNARRAVRDALSEAARRRARARVRDAKLALGERGRAWWLPADARALRRRFEASIRALLFGRRVHASICPSEVARVASGQNWRATLPAVRTVAVAMAQRGEIKIVRAGRVVRREPTKGILRYHLVQK